MPLLPIVTASNRPHVSSVNTLSPVLIINGVLLLLCAAMVLCYILWANGLAASNYKVSLLHTELIALGQVNNALQSQKTSMEDPTAVAAYATAQHMVPATNISYVFESSNVAIK